MNKVEVIRQNVLTQIGKCTVIVYKADTVYTSKVIDGRHEKLKVSVQYTRDPEMQSEEEVIRIVIARTKSKIVRLYHEEKDQVDYASLISKLSDEEKSLLCPPDWRKPSTRKAELAFFCKHTTALIQSILDAVDQTAAERDAQGQIVQIVRSNQDQRKVDGLYGDALENLDLRADAAADRHIYAANRIYDASRALLPQYDLPAIYIPRISAEKPMQTEQGKALPRAMMVRLAARFREDIAYTSLAVGAILMLCCMLRTAEACPRYGEIVDFGDFGVYGVLTQSDGSVRVAWTKSAAGFRLIIIPKYAMDAIRERREVLKKQGLNDEKIRNAYVVSHDDDPFLPMRPASLSAYIRKQMAAVGLKDDYWRSVSLLAAREPDMDVYGHVLGDLEAYVLRRSGCTHLVNCTTAPDVGVVVGGAPYALVDVLMGHRLPGADAHWREWVSREDNWPLIASMMESIILDPEHSAHPAFTNATTTVRGQTQVCHSLQRYIVTAEDAARGSVTLQMRCHNADGAVLRLPHAVQAEYKRLPQGQQHTSTYGVQEVLDKDYYAHFKAEQKKKEDEHGNEGSV